MTYLDHAATTPMVPEVISVVADRMAAVGNASSLHTAGRVARRSVEESRERLAAAIGARPSEVIFTGGGTESDNLAIKGIFWARRSLDLGRRRVLVSAVEHHAVLDTVAFLAANEGAEVELLPVDHFGAIDPEVLRNAIAVDPDSVALVSVMWANNEVGTIQPVAELAAICRQWSIPFHTDAVQAVGALDVSFAESGVDALTLTAHKLGGPYGVGALVLRRDVACTPLQHGGGQERDVRSGTLDTPGIVGFALATDLAVSRRPRVAPKLMNLRDALVAGVRGRLGDVELNGHPLRRLPGIAHFSFVGCEGDSLLMLLDARGIECSAGSACSAGVAEPSHVLLAMGVDPQQARGSLRVSLGHTSTEADVAAFLDAIGPVTERARRAGLASGAGVATWSPRP